MSRINAYWLLLFVDQIHARTPDLILLKERARSKKKRLYYDDDESVFLGKTYLTLRRCNRFFWGLV